MPKRKAGVCVRLPTAIEQLHQGLDIGTVRAEHRLVDAGSGKHGFQLGFANLLALGVCAPCRFSAGVYPFGLAGFRVLHGDPANGGELPVEGIGNTERYEVVLSARLTQRLVKTLIPEVGNEEGDGPLFHGG